MLRSALRLAVRVLLAGWVIVWLAGERGRFMLPSTREMLRAYSWRDRVNGRWWHAYIYTRWPARYIQYGLTLVFPRVRPDPDRRYWADAYHGKVMPTETAQALITINQDIPRQDLEQVVPYATAREIVLNGPPDVVALDCPCRANRQDYCQPLQVCMIVGKPFTDFVLEHHPKASRRLTQAEAVQLLQDEQARGHIHVAYFKDVMLNRFYAICNCCSCCCGGLEAMRYGVPMVTSSGYVAQVDAAECAACGTCAETCPFDAIAVDGFASVVWEACMGCGLCEAGCPQGAIRLVADARKGLPLAVKALVTPGQRPASPQ